MADKLMYWEHTIDRTEADREKELIKSKLLCMIELLIAITSNSHEIEKLETLKKNIEKIDVSWHD